MIFMGVKILLALDGSEPSMRAVQYVANMLGNRPDVRITLFHVLLPIPPSLLEGSTEYENELKSQRILWVKDEKSAEDNLFVPVRDIFRQAGFRQNQIQTKCRTSVNEPDVAYEILQECQKGDYDTVVMGKRGRSRIQTFLTGSVTEKIFRHAQVHAIWVIE
jgi:nucleotide-binding universal stress UspA family protein